MKKKNLVVSAVFAAAPARGQFPGTALVELFYWAAVCLVMASTAGVLSVAAGTPGLARAATLCCYLFTLLAGLLVLAGIFGPQGTPESDSSV